MKDLPEQLNNIPGISHGIYADDITIWTRTGSAGTQLDVLQEAIQTTEQHLRRLSLYCSPEKYELLLLIKRTRGRPSPPIPDIELQINNAPISKVKTLHLLGLTLQQNGAGMATLHKLKTTIDQVLHLIRRITNRRHGLKEQDTIRIVQA